MSPQQNLRGRLERINSPSLKSWQHPPARDTRAMRADVSLEMGWGRLIFGQTFTSTDKLFKAIDREQENQRDIAFYIRDPHVLLSKAPDRLFLDPSHTFRLWRHDYRFAKRPPQDFSVHRATDERDSEGINHIYALRKMVPCDPEFLIDKLTTKLRTYLVAETHQERRIIGTVTGVDHAEAFNDPEKGASLWCLAADPQANAPGVGEALVRQLVEHYFTRGRNYVDLSVLHDNREAIALYEKLGFRRVPVFCVKRKNDINEPLYVGSLPETRLNPYAQLIIKEARRRGIGVELLDEADAYFKLTLGGRAVVCRESLSELTSAIAMSRCDDKRLTHRVLKTAGLKVPVQFEAGTPDENGRILDDLQRVVVKPARGEQGNGISIDIQKAGALEEAVAYAARHCPDVIIEEFVEGQDLRLIVIDYRLVAAAVRRPPVISGNGQHHIKTLIEKYNRRRQAATGGESRVPFDDETERCVSEAGYHYDSVLPPNEEIQVRKAANLHTGGTIHDVTDEIHPHLVRAAEKAAQAIDIPVTGLDFCVPDLTKPDYVIIEANERPGLANHEPQPTAQRFIDLLFPQTISEPR
jgi:GNAT-family acetyltransferase (TIGR03103 family)